MTRKNTTTRININQNPFTRPINIILLSILCTVLWGSAFPSIKIGYQLFALANDDISGKLVFAGIRFFFAGIITLLISLIQNKQFPCLHSSDVKGMLLVSLFQTILEYIFFYIGLSQITGVKGSILTASSSFFVVLLAHFVYKNDKLNKSKFFGCSIGFAGIVLINLNGISSADLGFSLSGDGFMLLSALCFAIGSLISKNICQTADATVVTGYQLGIGGLVLMLLGFLTGGKLSHITLTGVLLLAYMSLLSAIAFTVWTVLSKYNRISQIAVYNFLTPVFGALLSALFLGDLLFTWNNLLALILVCIGIYIVNVQKVSS
ncbi:MAG: hypothetical protein K0S04_4425 [Herbinix sp.]|jgi:drug/metabolite transporter (DMT)-like permease|nr:hypothetical protein [Herbinix sp.]